MEHLSHSASKKSYRDNGYAGKMKTTVYDDVFGGPPRFGGAPTISPRLEDYTEIFESFHASRGSSIPILHLPAESAAADYDLFLDVRSSKFEYSEVFGGFDAADVGVSYEELLGCGGGSDGGGKSSDDDWTPAQSESLSDGSDPSASPERNPSMSNGDLDQSFGRMNQLKVTHNKPSTKTEEDMSNGKTHVTHFHAVPGGKVIPSRKIKDDQIPVQVSSDLHPSTDFGGLVTEEKCLRKTMSQPSEFRRGRYGTDLNLLSGHEKPCSDGTRPLLSVLDINLKTQPSQLPPPSRPPPALTSNKKDSDRTNSRLKPSKSYAYERRGGDTSPTYFDVEIDASSSAAVSAEAMRDAMEKAQAKLRSAKESRERKKDGLSSRLKLSDNDSNDKEARVSKNCDRSNSFENERMLGECEGEGSRMRYHTSDGRHKLKKTTLVIPGSIEGQKGVPVAENSVQSKHGKECKPSQGLCRTEETSALREETQFYEMLGDNNVGDKNIFEQTTRSRERGQNSGSVEAFEQQEDNRNINDATEACGWEEKQNQSEVSNGACQWNGSKERLMMPQKYHWQEHQEKVNVTRKACELKERWKKLSGSQHLGEIGKTLKEADESEDCENLIEIQLKEDNVEFEQKLKGTIGKLDTEKRLKNGFEREQDQMGSAKNLDWEYFVGLEDGVEQAENKRRVKKSVKQDAKERQQKEASERENEKKQEDHDRGESKRGVEEHHGLEENEKRLKRAFELEEIEKRSSMSLVQEENKQKLGSEIQENEKMLEEMRMQEENQNKFKGALALKENARKQKNACERVESEKIVDDGWNEEENERMHKKALNSEESRKTSHEGLTADKSTNEAYKEVVIEKKLEACDGEETEIMVQGAGDMDRLWEESKDHEQVEREEKKRRKNVNEEFFVGAEVKNSKELHGAYASNDIEILQASRVGKLDRDGDKFETTQEASSCEQEGRVKTDTIDCENEVEAVEGSEELIEKAKMRTEVIISHDTAARSNDGSIAIEKSVNENDNRAPEVVSKLENANILVHSQVEGGKNMKGAQCSIDHEISKGNVTWSQYQEGGDGSEAGTKNVDALPAVEGKRITISTAPKTTNQSMKRKDENHKETFTPAEKEKDEKLRRERELENDRLRKTEEREKEKGDKLRKERELENDRLRKLEEERTKERDEKLRKERVLESDLLRKMEEEREKEKDEKLRMERALESERLKKVEEVRVKEKEEKLRKERELESDRLRKMEEERERQREREKDLMAVDKATLETREKAFVEARERAERTAVDRASAEVRQKALAEARERLEKACAEARERTFAGKTSMEARLRAERAVVERAAAEARERAVEKGAAEKAAFARERDERSVADKLSSSSRSSGMKQNPSSSDLPDSHFRSLGSYSGSRYGHSSAYGGGESESPQRCKARLERHQRTAERAAKALAEKNMRDHLAQREQTERNRLAEGLDAEVKRWSSGKEGNLRALLSTLQYILGPDSGWQPVPLTDVITTAAVKKAYRKATLCVHPDKLQQRGASIHQKYICEKVFDLLKEAWNKFNSEER